MSRGRALRTVAAGLSCWVLLGPLLTACTASHTARPGAAAPAAAGSPARPLPSVAAVPAGTVIAPGATAVAGESAGVLPATHPPSPSPSGGPPAVPTSPGRTLRELQMNLCDSGEASCYTGGRAVDEAATLMRGSARPDMVTVNEVCRHDVVDALGTVMTALWPSDDIAYLFAPAVSTAGGPYRCRNGDVFGSGLLARVPAGQLTVLDTRYGLYTAQATDVEKRTFGCVDLAPRFAACVTHLESESSTVALTECTTLMSNVVPALRRSWGAGTPLIVAGDMNLLGGVDTCTPTGFHQVDDGALQHVLGSAGIQFGPVERFPMHETDHGALVVTLTLP